MPQAQRGSKFYRVYDLQAARNNSHGTAPAPHQGPRKNNFTFSERWGR